MAILSSTLRLSLLDRVTGPAARVNASLARLRGQAAANTAAMAGMGRSLLAMGGGVAGFAGVYGLGRAFTSSVNAAGEFEASMNRLRVVSGASGGQFDNMRRQALELGRTTQFMASEVGNAQNFLAMAGIRANEILSATPHTLQLAAAAGTDLAFTADLASNVMQQWGKEASQLGQVNDVLTTTFQNSNTNLAQLGEAMGYVAPVANLMGLSFEEVAAAVGLLGNAGIQGSRAGTGLQQSIQRLANPSKESAALLRKFGVNLMDANGNTRDFADIMEDFEDAFGDVSKAVLDTDGKMLDHDKAVEQLMGTGEKGAAIMEIFGARAGPAFAALLAQGSKGLRDFTHNVRNNEGATKRAADVMMTGWEGVMKRFSSAAVRRQR